MSPGQIKVRRILGSDGKEKIQLRIDLGVIQMETTGRPDARAPARLRIAAGLPRLASRRKKRPAEAYMLTPEEVSELQQEGIQYYHRYISLFQLNDFPGVIRDTQRNLDLFDFVDQTRRAGGYGRFAGAIPPLRDHDEHAGARLHRAGAGGLRGRAAADRPRPRKNRRSFQRGEYAGDAGAQPGNRVSWTNGWRRSGPGSR